MKTESRVGDIAGLRGKGSEKSFLMATSFYLTAACCVLHICFCDSARMPVRGLTHCSRCIEILSMLFCHFTFVANYQSKLS